MRVVAATNRDLRGDGAGGHSARTVLPPERRRRSRCRRLRERKDDIVPLANTFIRRFAGELKKRIDRTRTGRQKLLMRYNWPGNIRELENTVERAMLLTEGRRNRRPTI